MHACGTVARALPPLQVPLVNSTGTSKRLGELLVGGSSAQLGPGEVRPRERCGVSDGAGAHLAAAPGSRQTVSKPGNTAQSRGAVP